MLNSLSHIREKRVFNSLSHIGKKGSILWGVLKKSSILWVIVKKVSMLRVFCFFQKNHWITFKEKVQFFELNFKISSFVWIKMQNKKKSSILWVTFNKKIQFIWVISKKVQFFESYIKRFNYLSHFEKKWVLEVIRKKFNSMIHNQKKAIFWVIFKEQYLWVLLKKGFNSESLITRKTSSILRVIVRKGWNSSSNVQKKRFIFLSHIWKKKTVLSVIFWKIFESYPKKDQFLESCSKKKKGWILWVMFFWKKKHALSRIFGKKKFNSLSQIQKSGFNSLSNVEKKGSISMSYVKRKIQFCESCWKEGFNSLNYIFCFWKNSGSRSKRVQLFDSFSKKVNSLSQIKNLILWVILKKFYWKMFNSSNHILTRVQFFQSYWKKRFNSVSQIFQKRFNPLIDIQEGFNTFKSLRVFFFKKRSPILCVIFKQKVQFCKSYTKI